MQTMNGTFSIELSAVLLFFGKKKWPFPKATDQIEKTEKTRIKHVKNEFYKCKVVVKIPSLNYKRLEN